MLLLLLLLLLYAVWFGRRATSLRSLCHTHVDLSDVAKMRIEEQMNGEEALPVLLLVTAAVVVVVNGVALSVAAEKMMERREPSPERMAACMVENAAAVSVC